MWIYLPEKQNDHFTYSVGYFWPNGTFQTIDEFADEMQAMWRVHFLNGGSATQFP